ncbi:nucleotidyltransferase domain-containing protein [Candidatus Hydrogenedentota bacterium]
MREHHKKTVEKLRSELESDPENIALIIGGSVAKGIERVDSDIDCYIVATDERFDKALQERNVYFINREICDYEKGYVDAKLIGKQWMRKCAESGNEPTRWSFLNASVEFSRDEEIVPLASRIARYPKEEKEERMRNFLLQFRFHKWFCGEAFRNGNSYLLTHALGNLTLFGGRMILAHNEMLYPYHKWFLHELERAPDKPAGLMGSIAKLLESRDKPSFDAYVECIETFTDWPELEGSWGGEFVIDCEWSWLHSKTPIADI